MQILQISAVKKGLNNNTYEVALLCPKEYNKIKFEKNNLSLKKYLAL